MLKAEGPTDEKGRFSLDLPKPGEYQGHVDAIIHTAAIAGVWGKREVFEAINHQATLNVIDACRAHG